MKRARILATGVTILCLMIVMASCNSKRWVFDELVREQIHRNLLQNIRLGDGVPLSIDVTWRWTINNPKAFGKTYISADSFNQMILVPYATEIVNLISHNYNSVDSVFASQRKHYIDNIRSSLLSNLITAHIHIDQVILAELHFPDRYAQAKEAIGIKAQELEHIGEQSRVDIAQAEAYRKQAEADGKIQIAEAEAEGRLQKIRAETEKNRRASELARAETQAQVDRVKAQAEIEEKQMMARAELEKMRDLKNLELEKREQLDGLALDKERDLEQLNYENQVKLARLCTDNPVYASFLVNKELASKVEIAVLPTGTDPNVFGNLINNTIPSTR
ncbi:MAG: SPFH domain-containing protein [Saprospiraceae bacterium]|nr:SPFH domain-containing protein [Saprospiraceae bacterium]